MPTEETKAEAVARDKFPKKVDVIVEFIRTSPFLLASVIFHIGVILLLTYLIPRSNTASEKITLPVTQWEVPRPIKKHTESERHEQKKQLPQKQLPHHQLPQYQSGDKFAIATINAIADGKTLVVLMIDRSRSVVYGDLPQLLERMNHYFDEIDKNLPIELTDQGRWQVVSYGQRPRFIGKPSRNLIYIKHALRSAKVDGSGTENVAKPVNMVLDKFGHSKYKNILIACITDETGDDIQNPKVLERTINRMRKHNTRFYVFGYETVFAASKRRVRMKLDDRLMDALQGEDRAALRGFEGATLHGWKDAGPAAAKSELWWGEDWERWRRWGATLNGIRSGFGMYALNRMTLATQGAYFSLGKESSFDMDKMLAKYFPDICSKFTYKRRMEEVPLRKALKETWDQLGSLYLRTDLRTSAQVKENILAAQKGREYCRRRAKTLHRLVNNTEPQGANWARWVAHAEITRAELLRLRFMLGQYHLALQAAIRKHGKDWQNRGKCIVMRRGKVPGHYQNPQSARTEYNKIQRVIQTCITKHNGTPWAVAARRLQENVFPWTADVKNVESSEFTDKPSTSSIPELPL